MKLDYRNLPGRNSMQIIEYIRKHNGAWSSPYPFVMSKEGSGCFFKDIDNNPYLDFGSQIASNPLGYNHKDVINVVKNYAGRSPIKYAGQDFMVKEHADLLEELIQICPKGLDAAFIVNSGAEAVENAIKICMRRRPATRYCVSFESAFHGRTLGALSLTNSKTVQKKNYLAIPVKRLPFDENAPEKLLRLINDEGGSDNIGSVIIEPVQGEGGYNVADSKMMAGIRKVTKEHGIPFISDEVQAGMGRTGKWWAIENFNVRPDVISAAKALQVGATISNKKFFPEPGAISSTWGGGQIIDMAIGMQIIRTIKKDKLLMNIQLQGNYMNKRMLEIESISNVRGLGLMRAFDVSSTRLRDNLVIECLKNGLIVLGCGKSGIRMIPPYIVSSHEIDLAVDIIKKALVKCSHKKFKHKGSICRFVNCAEASI
jgi:4-aminobutyrate aminotransferase